MCSCAPPCRASRRWANRDPGRQHCASMSRVSSRAASAGRCSRMGIFAREDDGRLCPAPHRHEARWGPLPVWTGRSRWPSRSPNVPPHHLAGRMMLPYRSTRRVVLGMVRAFRCIASIRTRSAATCTGPTFAWVGPVWGGPTGFVSAGESTRGCTARQAGAIPGSWAQWLALRS